MKITNEIREFNKKCLINALEEELYYCDYEINKSFCFGFGSTKINIEYNDDEFRIRSYYEICLDMDPIKFKKEIKRIIKRIKYDLRYYICKEVYDHYSKELDYYKNLFY